MSESKSSEASAPPPADPDPLWGVGPPRRPGTRGNTRSGSVVSESTSDRGSGHRPHGAGTARTPTKKTGGAWSSCLSWLWTYLPPLVIIALGTGAAVLAYLLIEHTEHNHAEDVFASEWESRLTDLGCAVSLRIASTKAITAAIAALGAVPNALQYTQITSPWLPLNIEASALVVSVPNTPTAVANILSEASARHNRTVELQELVPGYSDSFDTRFIVLDNTGLASRFIGTDHGANPFNRAAFQMLNASRSDDPLDFPLALTPFLQARFVGLTAFVWSSPFPASPNSVITGGPFPVESVFSNTTANSPTLEHVQVTLHDQAGDHYVIGHSCSGMDPEFHLELSVPLNDEVAWMFSVDGCDDFEEEFTTSQRWAVVAAIAFVTILALLGWRLYRSFTSNAKQLELTRLLVQHTTATHARIVGYMCHQIRNPLHVLQSWLPTEENGFEDPRQDLSSAERTVVDYDISSATKQIQATVDDVLQLRRLENEPTEALYSPKMHDVRGLFSRIMDDCLADVWSFVRFSYILPSTSSDIFVDADVVGKITRCAIMNAMEFVSSGRVAVCVCVIRSDHEPASAWLVVDVRSPSSSQGSAESYDARFQPFSGHADGLSQKHQSVLWEPGIGSKSHVARMKKLREAARKGFKQHRSSINIFPATGRRASTFSRYSPGLSLPLARGTCNRLGGWFDVLQQRNSGSLHTWFVLPVSEKAVHARMGSGPSVDDVEARDSISPFSAPLGFVPSDLVARKGGWSVVSLDDGPAVADQSGGEPKAAPFSHLEAVEEGFGEGVVRTRRSLSAGAVASPALSPPHTLPDARSVGSRTGSTDGADQYRGLPPRATILRPDADQTLRVGPGSGHIILKDGSGTCESSRSSPRYTSASIGQPAPSLPGSTPSSLSEPADLSRSPKVPTPARLSVSSVPPTSPSCCPASRPLARLDAISHPSGTLAGRFPPALNQVTDNSAAPSTALSSSPRASMEPNSVDAQTGAEETKTTSAEGPAMQFADQRILVVDDETPNLRICSRMLSMSGVPKSSIVMLHDGQELVDFFGSEEETAFKPTVVLLDLLMPRKSGLEAMAELSLDIPVIATTGNVTDETTAQCKALGFRGMVAKPFSKDTLSKALTLALGVPDRAVPKSPPIFFVF